MLLLQHANLVRWRRGFTSLAWGLVLACGHPADAAQTSTATITYPADGAVNADLTVPIQWTAVADVQTYYLYVGTSVGARNVVDTGEILQTSYLPSNLPTRQTLYVRLWTKAGGVWRYADSTFSAGTSVSLAATITSPADGSANADLSQLIQWTSVPNPQAYYLYVGTTFGAKDLVDTGETLHTSFLALNLPSAQTLYARLWTKANGIWRYTDSTFSGTALRARLMYPADGAVNVDVQQPIRWSSVANPQAYYLYVGTTAGAKDVVDTGETLQTSLLPVSGLPSGQVLYVRLWTKLAGVWRFVDSTFTAAPILTARLTYPADGATNSDLRLPIRWTSVANVQTYYLDVGTAVGAKDLVDSGETLQVSYLTPTLPAGQVLYARLWTKAGGVWRYKDSTFTAAAQAPVTATISYPPDGTIGADLTLPVQWTSVANAQTYYLYIGTSSGAKDLVDSGELLQTSYGVQSLPVHQVVYARLWTKVGGTWRFADSSFSAGAIAVLSPTLIYPADGAVGVDQSLPITWTSVTNAQAYYLHVGSTPGSADLLDSGQTALRSYPMTGLPSGQTLYGRVYAEVDGVWRYQDSTFTAAPIAPEFRYPVDGATEVDGSQPFQWTAPANAQAHQLIIGTSVAGNDVFDSGEISGTSAIVSGLPATGTLYARVWSKINGAWSRHTDIAFTLEPSGVAANIVVPSDGLATFDTMVPFEWTEVPLGRAYRLTIGTAIGTSDLHDSGEIHVTRRFVPGLPVGVPLYGRIQTKIDGQWLATDFVFTVASNTFSAATQIQTAFLATDAVRRMAGMDNRAFQWTALSTQIGAHYFALCTDYAATLLDVLADMNLQAAARRLDLSFNASLTGAHTLVEMFDTTSQRWLILDPTFDLTARRSDSTWATADDVGAATSAFNWSAVSYDFLGPDGDAYVRHYYLDYPLLFLNVYHQGDAFQIGAGPSTLPYLLSTALPASDSPDIYVAHCLNGQAAVDVIIDGVLTTLSCDGAGQTSGSFQASDVASPAPAHPDFSLYLLNRFVF
jgi:hypothetical protein